MSREICRFGLGSVRIGNVIRAFLRTSSAANFSALRDANVAGWSFICACWTVLHDAQYQGHREGLRCIRH